MIVTDWIDKLYSITHGVYEDTPKEKRETLGLPVE